MNDHFRFIDCFWYKHFFTKEIFETILIICYQNLKQVMLCFPWLASALSYRTQNSQSKAQTSEQIMHNNQWNSEMEQTSKRLFKDIIFFINGSWWNRSIKIVAKYPKKLISLNLLLIIEKKLQKLLDATVS